MITIIATAYRFVYWCSSTDLTKHGPGDLVSTSVHDTQSELEKPWAKTYRNCGDSKSRFLFRTHRTRSKDLGTYL